MSETLVSNVHLRIVQGAHWVNFLPDIPQIVPEYLVQACIRGGAKHFDGSAADDPEPVTHADRTQELVDVMLDILAEGDPKLLTTDLEPRFDVIQKRVDFKFSKAERETAWAIASGVNGDSE